MKNLNIIITMGGIGLRFTKAGYNMPKYMIEAKGKTLFEWSLESLKGFFEVANKFIFVVKKEDCAKDFIKKHCQKFNIIPEIIELTHVTDGQATSAKLGIEKCNLEEGILIYNIDTYVEPFEMKYEDLKGDGSIPCFKAEGNHWSFVKTDDKGQVVEVQEKNRISDNCSLGAYYFSSGKLYLKIYNEFYEKNSVSILKEKYIAPMYNYMIKMGYKLSMSLVESKKVHVLGTPEELSAFIAEEENEQ